MVFSRMEKKELRGKIDAYLKNDNEIGYLSLSNIELTHYSPVSSKIGIVVCRNGIALNKTLWFEWNAEGNIKVRISNPPKKRIIIDFNDGDDVALIISNWLDSIGLSKQKILKVLKVQEALPSIVDRINHELEGAVLRLTKDNWSDMNYLNLNDSRGYATITTHYLSISGPGLYNSMQNIKFGDKLRLKNSPTNEEAVEISMDNLVELENLIRLWVIKQI